LRACGGRANAFGNTGITAFLPHISPSGGANPRAAMLLCGSAIADTASSAILLAVEQQRIGPITPSVPAAGLDPAYVPGLTPPRSGADEAAGTVPEQADAPQDAAVGQPPAEPAESAERAQAAPKATEVAEPEDAVEPAADDSAAGEDSAGDDSPVDATGTTKEGEDGEDATPDFEVSDRRGAIVADRIGVRFRLDEEEAEFGWDEIAAVEIDTPRFGRRFGVTVYTPEHRWYEAQVDAPSRGVLKEWTAQLDAVLDTHFEDEDEKAAKIKAEAEAEAASAEDPETDADADAEVKADADADAETEAAEDGEEGPADAKDADPAKAKKS
jgi:hypothetical protein